MGADRRRGEEFSVPQAVSLQIREIGNLSYKYRKDEGLRPVNFSVNYGGKN
jgi:hypothetical protein